MTKITQEHLNKVLWNAADSSRSSLDEGVYKDYLLVMLFYKYLSGLSKVQHEKYKERFGSDEKRILLNPELIKASKERIDYVITHELCQMQYQNHSQGFYRLLSSKCLNWKEVKENLELRFL